MIRKQHVDKFNEITKNISKEVNVDYCLGGTDSFLYQKKDVDDLKLAVSELTQALIKEQEEVLKYKPIYLKLIAENEILKQKLNCKHTFVGKSENQYCSKCGIE